MTVDAGGLESGAARLPASFTLRGRHVLPMTGADDAGVGSRPPVFEDGFVSVRRGRIVAVGRGGRGARGCGPVIDCGTAILLPGLVNAHTHLEFSDCERPLVADGGLPGWIGRVVALRRGRGADEGVGTRAGVIARGLAESAAAGVTTIGEISTGLDGILPDGGRGMPPGPRLRVFREALGLSAAAAAAALRGLAADLPRLARGGIAAGISPHAPYTVARGLGARLIDAALVHRLPVAMHLAESREEAVLLARGAGTLRELLESLGAWPAAGPGLLPVADWISRLARGRRGIVVHGTFLPEDATAMARLVRHRDRLVVAVCPRTTRSLSGGLPPVEAFLDRKVRVAIGTDSRASNPDLDLRAECRALVAAGLASPAESLWMATRAGAFALGFEQRCGRLAPGFAADIAVLAPEAPVSDPFHAALAPETRVVATLRGGQLIAGDASIRLPSGC